MILHPNGGWLNTLELTTKGIYHKRGILSPNVHSCLEGSRASGYLDSLTAGDHYAAVIVGTSDRHNPIDRGFARILQTAKKKGHELWQLVLFTDSEKLPSKFTKDISLVKHGDENPNAIDKFIETFDGILTRLNVGKKQ